MLKRIARTIALATALVLVTGLMATGVAVAQEPETDANGTILHGRGALWAKGRGVAILDMGGTLRMHIRGNVVINDLAGDATIVIEESGDAAESDRAADGGTKVVLENFSGSVVVRGSHFRVRARGRMVFLAKGQGTAFLAGRGVWRTPHNYGVWSQGGFRLDFGPD